MTGFCIGESKTVEHKDGQWYFDGATDDLGKATEIRDSNIWVVGRNSKILEVK